MDKANILEALRTLDAVELNELRTHIAALQVDNDDSALTSAAAERVYAMVVAELRRAGVADATRISYRRMRMNKAEFNGRCEALTGWLREQDADRRVQDAILRTGIMLLVENYRERAERFHDAPPVTPKVICDSIHRVPSQLDREFPGYAAAGLLPLIAGPPPADSRPRLALVAQ